MENSTVRVSHGYTVIPDAIIDREDITSSELLCYIAIARHASKEGSAFPGYKRIAANMKSSRSTAIRAVASLVEKGLLVKEARTDQAGDQASNLYTLNTETTRCHRDTGGSVTMTPPVVSQRHPKDSQFKDSQREGKQGTPEYPAPPLDYSQVEEWADDKHVDADAQSLKAMSELHPDRHVIEQAFKAWLSREKGARVKLHYFVKQAHPFITSELQELQEYEKMLHDAENRRRAADADREKHAKELAEIAECEKLEADGVPLAEICKLYPEYTSILRFRQLCETMKGGAA
jgi:hypothetical protein